MEICRNDSTWRKPKNNLAVSAEENSALNTTLPAALFWSSDSQARTARAVVPRQRKACGCQGLTELIVPEEPKHPMTRIEHEPQHVGEIFSGSTHPGPAVGGESGSAAIVIALAGEVLQPAIGVIVRVVDKRHALLRLQFTGNRCKAQEQQHRRAHGHPQQRQ